MKVDLSSSTPRWKTGLLHTLGVIFLLIAPGCDFDIPEKFEMPTWFIDIKLPLVQTKYEMSNIANPDYHIYPTDDSMGFQVIYEGVLEPQTIEPEYLKVDFPGGYLDVDIPEISFPGIPASGLELPDIPAIDQKFDMVFYGVPMYTDTTGNTFSFPITEKRVMSAENYNSQIIDQLVVNTLLGAIFDGLASLNPLDLGLETMLTDLALDPPILKSIDTINIADTEESKFVTYFENRGIPTNLTPAFSRLVTGNEELSDTLVNHNPGTLATGETFLDTTMLGGKGLCNFIELAAGLLVEYAEEGTFVELWPEGNAEGHAPSDSIYVKFKIEFALDEFTGIDITTNDVDLPVPLPEIGFPSSGATGGGTTRLELFRCVLEQDGVPLTSNRLQVMDLRSTLPFDIDFLMNFKNFFPPPGNDSVKIDQTLESGETYNFDFSLKGDTLRALEYPDSAIGQLELDVAVTIPEQKTTIPFNTDEIGSFGLGVRFGSLNFKELEAFIYQGFPSVPTEQELPQGFKGVTLADVRIQFIMDSQIRLPVKMNMDFIAIDVFNDITRLIVDIDTVGYPASDSPGDTSRTIIELNRFGTQITIYESLSDSLPSYDTLKVPCDECGTIIDVMAANPATLIVDAEARIDGRGTIVAGASLGGGFKLVAPFALIMEPMTIMSQPTVLEEMDYQTRNRIRSSLIQSDMVFDITNSLPFGAELSVLLSNAEFFPTDTTMDMLSDFRDSMAAEQGWNPTDDVYIIKNCTDLSPENSNIYIFNVMTDHNECIDGMPYIIRSDGTGVDTVISYVDTLFKFILPFPDRLYTDEDADSLGVPTGMVAEPGTATYASILDTSRLRLITDYGDHYVLPRFHLEGTDGQMVFISINDYLEVGSFITFRVSSTGMFAPANSELLITDPNGGETLYTDQIYTIEWRTFGDIANVNLHYSIDPDSNISSKNEWHWAGDNGGLIVENIPNDGTYDWDISGLDSTDFLRIRITSVEKVVLNLETDKNEIARDINGWYLKVRDPSSVMSTLEPEFIGPRFNELGSKIK